MFNETTADANDPITLHSAGNYNPRNLPIQGGPCGPGEVPVDVGADAAVCMTQTDLAAFLQGSVSAAEDASNVKPGGPFGLTTATMLTIGIIGAAVLLLGSGRR